MPQAVLTPAIASIGALLVGAVLAAAAFFGQEMVEAASGLRTTKDVVPNSRTTSQAGPLGAAAEVPHRGRPFSARLAAPDDGCSSEPSSELSWSVPQAYGCSDDGFYMEEFLDSEQASASDHSSTPLLAVAASAGSDSKSALVGVTVSWQLPCLSIVFCSSSASGAGCGGFVLGLPLTGPSPPPPTLSRR